MSGRYNPGEEKARLHRAGRKILAVILIVFGVLCGTELVLHLLCRITKGMWYPVLKERESPPFYDRDSTLGWRLRPDMSFRFVTREFDTHIITDGEGFRKREDEETGAPVIVVGDSFTFGWGVETGNAFPCLMSKRLKIPFISKGVPGYGLEQEELLLGEVLRKEPPRLIVLETWPLDWDILNSDKMIVAEHHLVTRAAVINRPRWYVNARIALNEWSPLYGTVTRVGSLMNFLIGRHELLGGYGLDVYVEGAQPESIAEARNRAFAAIRKMKAQADSLGIPFAMVIVPSVFQVYPERLKSWSRLYGISGPLDATRPNRELKEFAEGEGIYMLDLLPFFKDKASNSKELLYFASDPHWNSNGHECAGQVISEFLITNGLLR